MSIRNAKTYKIAAITAFCFFSFSTLAQALTFSDIYQAQTGGRVLGAATPTRIQAKSAGGTNIKTASLVFDNPTTSGNELVLAVDDYYQADGPFTVTDSLGNTWQTAIDYKNNAHLQIFYAENIIGGSGEQITVASPSAGYFIFTAVEYSGLATSSSIDVFSGNRATSASYASASVTTTQAGDLLFGAHNAYSTNAAFTPASPWVTVATKSDNVYHELQTQEQIGGSAGSYASSGSLPSSFDVTSVIVAFKPSASSGTSGSIPVISSFTASPSSITSGQSSTLSWSTSGASSVSISSVGSVPVSSSSSVSPTVSTTYTLTASNSSGSATAQTTVSVSGSSDTTPPVISGISSSGLTSSSASISWATNENSDSQVDYGITNSYGLTSSLNSSLSTSHTVFLSGLSASSLYHYRVKSKDSSGNLAVSVDNTFTTSAGSTGGGGAVSWTKMSSTSGWPAWNGYLSIWYDPVSHQTILYGHGTNSSSIYSTDIFFYNALSNAWTHLGGTGSTIDTCPTDLPNQPGDRHPVNQMAVDTTRNVLWIWGGVCQGNNRQDMYYLTLNANPLNDVWHQVNPAHYPIPNNSSALVYDSDDDILFNFGYDGAANLHDNWIYCPTSGTGILTAKQSAAGCASPDDWKEVSPVGGVQPPGSYFPGAVYDTVTKNIIQYGGQTGGGTPQNQTWAYSVPAHTWTQKALSTTAPPVYSGPTTPQPAMAYNPTTHHILYHQTSNTGAPADWEYDPVGDTWTPLSSTGSGSNRDTYLAYDSANNMLIGWNQNALSGVPEMWHGAVGGLGGASPDTTAPSVPANLNGVASTTSASLSWTASTDNVALSYYTVYRNGSPVGNPITNSFTDTGLTPGTSYTYTVSATDSSNNSSAQSTSKSVTTTISSSDTTAPSVPANLSASAQSSSSINLSWTASTDNVAVTGYKIYRGGVQVGTSATNSFSDSNLSASTNYSYTASAYDAAGNNSAQSSSASATTQSQSSGTVITPLTIQEAIYPGSVSGVTRTQDPLTMGIPLAQSANITNVIQLGLSGASVGQFRVLGCWSGAPTPAVMSTSCGGGAIKWVEIDTEADVSAGQTNTGVSLTTGSGSFGGANLAADNGATINVDTGTGQFTIKKANFNVIDQAVVNGKTIIQSGASQGLVLMGPNPTAAFPANVTCSPTAGGSACATAYSSANDPGSTCTIEENGPAKAVIKCDGNHVDGANHVYMHYTLREYFYKNKSSLKVTSILRNADYGTSNTFASAYKGFAGYDLRLGANISGTLNYTVGDESAAPTTGTMSGSDDVYLYQGESKSLQFEDNALTTPATTDKGFTINKNGAVLHNGTDVQYPQGWCDIKDSTGAGIEVGVYQMAAYWPKSCEFAGGGSDVRIGISPMQNSKPYYADWPQWQINDLYLNFHDTSLAAPANDFLKFQHYLLARAPYAYYNSTAALPYALVNPAMEDAYTAGVYSSAQPSTIAASNAWASGSNTNAQDFGTLNSTWALNAPSSFSWNLETEYRYGYMMNFLTRGMTGRWLEAAHFYRFQSEYALEHSDGFNWRDKGLPGISADIDGFGKPKAVSANSSLGPHPDHNGAWKDQEHGHWYGQTDYYFLTGDETNKDAMLDEQKDWFVLPNSYQDGASGGMYNTRAVSTQLLGVAQFADFLKSIGDSDYTTVQQQGLDLFNVQVKPDLCASGYPQGCNYGTVSNPSSWRGAGVSRVRGIPWGASGGSGNWCGLSNSYRVNSLFQASLLGEALTRLHNYLGPTWSDYWTSSDLAYGISQWALSEGFSDDGSGRWDSNGFRFGVGLDVRNDCNGMTDQWTVSTNGTTVTNLGSKPFRTDGTWTPSYSAVYGIQLFNINGVGYTIRSVQDANHLTLTSSAGNQNSATAIYQEQDFVPQVALTTFMHFVDKYATDGQTDWLVKAKIDMQKAMGVSGLAFRDVLGYQTSQLVNILTNPTMPALNNVPINSVQDLGSGNYKLTWTVPTGAQSYRIKWGNKPIVDWIGFDPGTNSFIGDPNTTMNWFAANNASNIPAPASGGSSQSFTVSTATTGLTAADFSVKAYQPANPNAPVISSFSASPSSITSGGSSSLSWSVSNSTSLSIDQGVGTVTGTSKVVSPTVTTTYTLTATNGSGSVTQTATVTVSAPQAPIISSLVASNLTATSTTLSWQTDVPADTQVSYGLTASYGQSSTLTDTSPQVTSHSVTLSSLTPATTYHFSVLSRGANSLLAQTGDFTLTTLSLPLPPAPSISSFTPNPSSITLGQSSLLSFTVTGSTTSLSLNQGIGSVLGQNSKSISPIVSTTYTLTAQGPGGTATAQVTVTVGTTTGPTTTAPTILSFTINPSSIILGQTVTLNFQATGTPTPTLSIDNSIGTVLGLTKTITPSTTTTYTLTAVNSAGTATAQATVNVTAAPTGGGGSGGSSGGTSGGAGGSGTTNTTVPTVNPDGSITFIPKAITPTSTPSSTLRLINSNGTFYLIKNNLRYGITSPGILYSYGFEFKDAKTATQQDLSIPLGTLLLPGNGYLVKSAKDKTVYLISNNQRYAFTSAVVFTSLGFSFTHVFLVTDPELQSLPQAQNISDPNSKHLPGLDINRNGTIYWVGTDNLLHGYPNLSVYNSWHRDNDFSQVVTANAADSGLPVGDLVLERILQ